MRYLNCFPDRFGKPRYYFRRNGKRTPLPGEFGSDEFMAAYASALADATDTPLPRLQAKEGTFNALATRYFGSPKFRGLSKSSKVNYRRVIEGFLKDHGHRIAAQFQREHVDIIIGNMEDKPGAGIVLLKRIRTLCRYGVEIKWMKSDPTAGATSYKSTEIHTWTDSELQKFEDYWPSGTKQRLGYALHLYTGQRGSDVRAMSRTHIAGDTIAVVQEKTDQKESDERLVIPMHKALLLELRLNHGQHVMLMTTAYGKAFTVKGFANFMSDAIRAAGLPEECVPHGLRKAAARRLAECGCSAKEIQAITGHKSLGELEKYVRKADQVKLARSAIERQDANRSGKPTLVKVANRSKSGGK